jgi:hypothetical protein
MPSLKMAQLLLEPETQRALSLPTAALILGAVSQVERLMDIVDRVCNPVYCGAPQTATYADAPASVARTTSLPRW